MVTITLDLPAMYGDHHVVEVRRILLEMPGIESVYASSSFQAAEVTYDPARIDADAISARLGMAGYLGELLAPLETGELSGTAAEKNAAFRHTIAYQQTGRVIGFAQNITYTGRPLWPCPGMEPLKNKERTNGEERP